MVVCALSIFFWTGQVKNDKCAVPDPEPAVDKIVVIEMMVLQKKSIPTSVRFVAGCNHKVKILKMPIFKDFSRERQK
jgi:hypothetical protein